LKLEYNADHYGASSTDSFALIKSQLESTGLFKVDLQSTEWVQYGKERVADAYPEFQLGWYADYLDAQDFFQPLYGDGGFINNHFNDPALLALITKQATTNGDSAREALDLQIQQSLAAQLPIVPILQSSATVVADKKVGGVVAALATGGMPFGAFTKGS
jgi:peptide/nickel transport system substrate-binding protein